MRRSGAGGRALARQPPLAATPSDTRAEEAERDGDRPPTRWRRWGPYVVGLLIGAGALYAVVASAGGVSDAIGAVGRADAAWVVAAGLAEAGSYFFLGVLLRRLAGPERPVPLTEAIDIGLVVAGLGNILPAAPAEGLTLAASELRRRGLSRRRVAVTLGFAEWSTTRAAFGVLAVTALVVIAVAETRFPGRMHHLWVLASAGVVILAGLAVTAWLVGRPRTFERLAAVAIRLGRWRRGGRPADAATLGAGWYAEASAALGAASSRRRIAAMAVASPVADIVCFGFSLHSVGVEFRPALFVFAYGLALVVSLVPLLPAGLGAVEVAVPALLHRTGIPLATALAGVLVYRALGTALPALAGVGALLRLRLGTLGGRGPGGRRVRGR